MDLLRHMAVQYDLPWIIGGDFNEILNNEEKEGVPHSDQLIEMFLLASVECSLSDLGFVGNKFTWSNHRSAPYTVCCRLNKVCANSSWVKLHTESFVKHLRYTGSDHVPLLFHIHLPRSQLGETRRRPWRFEAQWIRRFECEDIIKDGWQSSAASDSFERLFHGVDACQMGLRLLMRGGLTNPKKRITELREQVDNLSKGDLTDSVKEELAWLRLELEHMYMDEELYWCQQCKNQWATEGDRNTHFFHAKALKRRRNNSIIGLMDSAGVWKEKMEEVEGIILEYFGSLFQTSSPDPAIIDEILAAVVPVVTLDMNQRLTAPLLSVEITHALYQMSPLKSLGADDFLTVFFS